MAEENSAPRCFKCAQLATDCKCPMTAHEREILNDGVCLIRDRLAMGKFVVVVYPPRRGTFQMMANLAEVVTAGMSVKRARVPEFVDLGSRGRLRFISTDFVDRMRPLRPDLVVLFDVRYINKPILRKIDIVLRRPKTEVLPL